MRDHNQRHRPAEVLPIDAPSRAELWRRVRLAESILCHRTVVPVTTRDLLLKVLRGESVAEPEKGVS